MLLRDRQKVCFGAEDTRQQAGMLLNRVGCLEVAVDTTLGGGQIGISLSRWRGATVLLLLTTIKEVGRVSPARRFASRKTLQAFLTIQVRDRTAAAGMGIARFKLR